MLEIRNFSVSFSSYTVGLKRTNIKAIRSLDLNLKKSEVLAVVGQSGSGKSLLAHAMLGVLPKTARISGSLVFKDQIRAPEDFARLRGREIALIPQSVTYLNPLRKVGAQVARAGELSGIHPRASGKAALNAMKRYRLDADTAGKFPFQLSGGMARRILTATATIGKADLILADEPTNGLDKGTAEETLGHLRELADCGKAILLITHDIEAALSIADRISIFCAGLTVEDALSSDFNKTGRLRHPYSRMLWDALPRREFIGSLPKKLPSLNTTGCPFSAGCEAFSPKCAEDVPPLIDLNKGRVRCYHA